MMALSSSFRLNTLSSSSSSCRSGVSNNIFRCHLISSEFNITFAPPKPNQPKPKPVPLTTTNPNPNPNKSTESSSFSGGPLYIPWIVRDEKGNLGVQSHPPASLLHAMANAKTTEKKKKKTTPIKMNTATSTTTKTIPSTTTLPHYSKAARRFYNQNFRDQPQRLAKVLASAGVASRRSSEDLIFNGRVTVNGSLCNTPQTKVDPGKDIIYVNGNRLNKKLPPKLYFALNKPKGYICSSGENESKSVLCLFDDYFKNWNKLNQGIPKPRLFTVGRLDVATTGLIIVTNDGDFAQRLSHPSSNLSKEYIATVEGDVTKRQLVGVSEGTIIDGVRCIPDSVELLPKQPDITRQRLRIVVHEGRNHEVRELVKNAGMKMYSLKRIRIGGFRLPTDLGLGKHMELRPTDLKALG